MSKHIITLIVERSHTVYVEDKTNKLTKTKLVEKAKELAIQNKDNLILDKDVDVDRDDIVNGWYDCEIKEEDK